MAREYQFEAVDAAGKRTAGTLAAESEADLRRQLFAQGLVLKRARTPDAPGSRRWRRLFERRLPTSELILFTQQLRTLYVAGIPLAEIFRILHDQT